MNPMKTWLISIFAAVALSLSGCTTGSALRPVAAQLAVQYATLKVIENNPDHAGRIAEISASVRAAASGQAAATVAVIDSLIRAQIRWEKLSPADVNLVNILLLAVRAELEARVGSGVIDSQAMLTVAQVAGWIEQAAASTLRAG
jgi:hypothetical protein